VVSWASKFKGFVEEVKSGQTITNYYTTLAQYTLCLEYIGVPQVRAPKWATAAADAAGKILEQAESMIDATQKIIDKIQDELPDE